MSSLSRSQFTGLLRGLDASRVGKDDRGHSHLEAWDVRRHLIRVFGFGGWDFTVVDSTLVAEWTHPPKDANAKPRYSVVYRVIGRLTIRTLDGVTLCVYEDGAVGDSMNQPSFGDAHDMALKTAMSQALKRCAVNLGDQFGLGLYNDGRTDPVVVGSYVSPPKDVTDGPSDGDRGSSESRPTGAGPGPDGESAGGGGPGGDGEAGRVRPGVQPGVPVGERVDGPAQARGGRRDTSATVGG